MFDLDFVVYNNILLSEALLVLSAVSFFVGLYYLLSFLKVTYHKNVKVKSEGFKPASVVVIVGDEIEYLRNSFESVLNQDYPCDYQVVVVNYKPERHETIDYLEVLKEKYPEKLYVTTIKRDGTFHNARRLAYTLGIKAAKYENIVFTDPKVSVNSNLWLKSITRSFAANNQLVVSYVDVKAEKGVKNSIFRAVNTYDTLMWLSAAKRNNMFRANIMNLGLNSNMFFKIGGYRERLRLNTGESDLFVQKIVESRVNNGLIIAKTATVSKDLSEYSLSRWFKNQIFDFYTTKFYKSKDFAYLTFEPLFSFLFWVASVSTLLLDYNLWYFVLIMVILRWGMLCFTISRFAFITGSKIPYFTCLLYDIFGVYYKVMLFLGRKFNPSFDLWIRMTN